MLSVAVLGLILICWAAHYRRAAVRRPHLEFDPLGPNPSIVDRLPRLRQPYKPTPWLYNAHLQLLWLLLREAVAPALRYERTEILRMRDGGTTALHWLGTDCAPSTPTLIVLHSITGDSQSMRLVVADLRRATGWRVVVCVRRGHDGLPLTAPVLNTMGCTDDLREQLRWIQKQFPESPLCAVGVSAGSALLVRYLGEEGLRSIIRAGVAYCPGYDISVAWNRVKPFYSRAMAKRLKRYFLQQHARALGHLGSYHACLATQDLAQFHEHFFEIAGCSTLAEYLARSNPVPVFNHVATPLLIINADDDPVCVVENAVEHLETVRGVSKALLVRTARGSHCAFFEGWRARSWANGLMAEYLVAALAAGSAIRSEGVRIGHTASTTAGPPAAIAWCSSRSLRGNPRARRSKCSRAS